MPGEPKPHADSQLAAGDDVVPEVTPKVGELVGFDDDDTGTEAPAGGQQDAGEKTRQPRRRGGSQRLERRQVSPETLRIRAFASSMQEALDGALLSEPAADTDPAQWSFRAYRRMVDASVLGIKPDGKGAARIIEHHQDESKHAAARDAAVALLTTEFDKRTPLLSSYQLAYDALVQSYGDQANTAKQTRVLQPEQRRGGKKEQLTMAGLMSKWRNQFEAQRAFAVDDVRSWFSARVRQVEDMLAKGTAYKGKTLAEQLQYIDSVEFQAALAELDKDVDILIGKKEAILGAAPATPETSTETTTVAGSESKAAAEEVKYKRVGGVIREIAANTKGKKTKSIVEGHLGSINAARNGIDRTIARLRALLPDREGGKDGLTRKAEFVRAALGPTVDFIMPTLLAELQRLKLSPLEEMNFWDALVDLFNDIAPRPEKTKGERMTPAEIEARAKKIVRPASLHLLKKVEGGITLNLDDMPESADGTPKGFKQMFAYVRAEAKSGQEYRDASHRTKKLLGKAAEEAFSNAIRGLASADRVKVLTQLNELLGLMQWDAARQLGKMDRDFATVLGTRHPKELGRPLTPTDEEKTKDVLDAEILARKKLIAAMIGLMGLGTEDNLDANRINFIIDNIRKGREKKDILLERVETTAETENDGTKELDEDKAAIVYTTYLDRIRDNAPTIAPEQVSSSLPPALLKLLGAKRTEAADRKPAYVQAAESLSARLDTLLGDDKLKRTLLGLIEQPGADEPFTTDAAQAYVATADRVVYRLEQAARLLGSGWAQNEAVALVTSNPDDANGYLVDEEDLRSVFSTLALNETKVVVDAFALADGTQSRDEVIAHNADTALQDRLFTQLELPKEFVAQLFVAAAHTNEADLAKAVKRVVNFMADQHPDLKGKELLLADPAFAEEVQEEGKYVLKPKYQELVVTMKNDKLD